MRNTQCSIIIPTLNEELFVGRLLESIAIQTFRQFEVIVVDASSKDNTVGVIEQFQYRLPKLSILQTKKGNTSYQRNLGAKHAQYQNLLFLDADVILPKSFLEQGLKSFIASRAYIATPYSIAADGDYLDSLTMRVTNSYMYTCRKVKPLIYGWAMFSKKKIHSKIGGFDEKLFFYEDSDYCQRMIKAGGTFQFITNTEVYASMRRAHYEGRVSMYRKQALFVAYSLIYRDIYKAQNKINWNYGDFKNLTRLKQRIAKTVGSDYRPLYNLSNDPLWLQCKSIYNELKALVKE